jgi:hypothetical protein
MISKQVKISSNKELTSAPGNEEANTQRHSFIAGLHVDRPKNGVFVQEPRARQEREDLQKRKKKNLLIVQFVYCEYVLSLDGFSDSIC